MFLLVANNILRAFFVVACLVVVLLFLTLKDPAFWLSVLIVVFVMAGIA